MCDRSVTKGPASGGTSISLLIQNLPHVESEDELIVKFDAAYGSVDFLFPWSQESTQVLRSICPEGSH